MIMKVIVMKYKIEGRFKIGESWQKFRKEIEAETKRMALEKLYSLMGSNHKIKRNLVKVDSIEEVK